MRNKKGAAAVGYEEYDEEEAQEYGEEEQDAQ